MSRAAGEISVILCHVPVYSGASGDNAVAWDSAELLELFDGFDHLKACFAGHYHPGGCAIRNGVLHKTVRAICNAAMPTAVIARVYPTGSSLKASAKRVMRVIFITSARPPSAEKLRRGRL